MSHVDGCWLLLRHILLSIPPAVPCGLTACPGEASAASSATSVSSCCIVTLMWSPPEDAENIGCDFDCQKLVKKMDMLRGDRGFTLPRKFKQSRQRESITSSTSGKMKQEYVITSTATSTEMY